MRINYIHGEQFGKDQGFGSSVLYSFAYWADAYQGNLVTRNEEAIP